MEYIEMTHAPYNSQGEMSHQPQQIGIVTEMMRSMEGGRITTLDIQRIMDATLNFGMSLIVMTIIGVMVRDFLREALGPEKKERVKPVVDVVLPQTQPDFSANEIFARSKDYFGITFNPEKAGYILPDGTMLDFSGEIRAPLPHRRLAPILGAPGRRELDHREIAFAWPEDYAPSGFEAMKQVMNWGAIRFSAFHETIVVNLVQPPTTAQIREINIALRRQPNAVLVIEVDDAELTQIDYLEFIYPFIGWVAFVEKTAATANPLPATVTPKVKLKIWDAVDKEKLRQYCEQTYGVPVTTEASDYFVRLMDRRIVDFKGYLPLHLINRRGLTAGDMHRAASRYFG